MNELHAHPFGKNPRWEMEKAEELTLVNRVDGLLMQAQNLILIDRVDEAMEKLKDVISTENFRQKNRSVYVGQAYEEIGLYKEAIAWYMELEKDPAALDARRVHARLLSRCEQKAQALVLMKEVFARDPQTLIPGDYVLMAELLPPTEATPFIEKGLKVATSNTAEHDSLLSLQSRQ